MIKLTRLNRKPLILNSDLIETVETTPDTVVSLTTGQKIMVLETADEVVDKVVHFRRSLGLVERTAPPDPSPTSHGR